MKTCLITRIASVLAAAALLSSAVPAMAAVPDCTVVTTAGLLGCYAKEGNLAPYYFLTGWIPGGIGGEYRGFLLFDVPASDRPFVSGEIRVSVDYVLSPGLREVLQLHHVNTPLHVLTNYGGSLSDTFRDLGDGPLLGEAAFASRAPDYESGTPDRQVSIPLTADGLAYVNAARGRKMAFGGVVQAQLTPPGVEEVRLLQSLEHYSLILQRGDSDVPRATILNSSPTVLGGGSVTLSGLACGREPMARQWFKDGLALAGATNSLFVIDRVDPTHAGRYEIRASNELGSAISDPFDLRVLPATISSFPGDITALDGEMNRCLSTSVISYTTTDFVWRRNGIEVRRTEFPSLCFVRIGMADAGRYDFVARNQYGSVTSAVATVTVVPQAPLISYAPFGSMNVAAGLPLELEGLAYGTEPISYQWVRDQLPIPGATAPRLSIPSLNLADSGAYQLVAWSPYGSVTSQVARVTVSAVVMGGPYDVDVQMGARVVMSAQPSAASGTRFDWYRENVLLSGAGGPLLIFPAASTNDVGGYFVVASNVFGVLTSRVAELSVELVKPSVTVYSAKTFPALVGDEFSLWSIVNGGPPPILQWQRDGLNLWGQTNSTLVLRNVQPDDSGDYTLVAVNALGSAASVPLRVDVVLRAPTFARVPFNTNEMVGSVVTMESYAAAGPPARYQWLKRGVALAGATNATLVIANATAEDAAPYRIVARNSEGEASYEFDLNLRRRTALDEWDWKLPRPQGSRLRDITWGDGRFVAVGKSGNIISSTDGTNWTHSLIEADCDLLSVAYGEGRFVATAMTRALSGTWSLGTFYPASTLAGLILTSTNGMDWTPSQSPFVFPLHVTFGAGRFVLAGNGSVNSMSETLVFAYTSTNGVDWTSERFEDTGATWVSYVNNEFWASDSIGFYRSMDGISWQDSTRSLLGENVGLIGYGLGRYVTLGWYGQRGQSSTDGLLWDNFALGNLGIHSLAFGNSRFVATLSEPTGSILTSDDGRSWARRETGTSQELESVIFVEGQFWAVGEAGAILHSADGINWAPNLVESGTDYYGLTQLGGLAVAAGDNGTILTSSDGEKWTRQATPSGRNLHAVHAAGGLLVAGGRGGRIMTSPDAVNWTSRVSGTTNYVERILRGDRWMAACEGGDILTSTDGMAWSAIRTQPESDHEGLAYGAGHWLVVGGYFSIGGASRAISTAFISTDASRWNSVNVDVGVRLRDVAFGNGIFVAVGNDGWVVVISPTGDPVRPSRPVVSYNFQSLGAYWPGYVNLRRIVFQNGSFIAVGNDGAIFSTTDPFRAESWVPHRSRTSQNLHDILPAPDGTYYAVGNNGMILRSGAPQPYFTGIRFTSNGVRVEFNAATLPGPLRLEESADLLTWDLVTDRAVSPVDLPFVHPGARYFRLR